MIIGSEASKKIEYFLILLSMISYDTPYTGGFFWTSINQMATAQKDVFPLKRPKYGHILFKYLVLLLHHRCILLWIFCPNLSWFGWIDFEFWCHDCIKCYLFHGLLSWRRLVLEAHILKNKLYIKNPLASWFLIIGGPEPI